LGGELAVESGGETSGCGGAAAVDQAGGFPQGLLELADVAPDAAQGVADRLAAAQSVIESGLGRLGEVLAGPWEADGPVEGWLDVTDEGTQRAGGAKQCGRERGYGGADARQGVQQLRETTVGLEQRALGARPVGPG
jgi:hypothetical protein